MPAGVFGPSSLRDYKIGGRCSRGGAAERLRPTMKRTRALRGSDPNIFHVGHDVENPWQLQNRQHYYFYGLLALIVRLLGPALDGN